VGLERSRPGLQLVPLHELGPGDQLIPPAPGTAMRRR
jgi:hypothetical protein